MDQLPVFVGIDVAKDRLDVHLRPSGEAFAVARNGEGLDSLVTRLAGLKPALVVLEATGGFEITVAAALAAASLPLVVVNPRQIRDFARALGRRAKTDALDAEAIALFAERIQPQPRPVPDEQARHLAELVARRRQIVEMLSAKGSRRQQARDKRLAGAGRPKKLALTASMRKLIPAQEGACPALACGFRSSARQTRALLAKEYYRKSSIF